MSHATFVVVSPCPRAGCRPRRSIALWTDLTQPSGALSPDRRKRFGPGLAGKRIFHIGSGINGADGPIAQLDRVTDFYSVGCRFESCWDRQSNQRLLSIFESFSCSPSRHRRSYATALQDTSCKVVAIAGKSRATTGLIRNATSDGRFSPIAVAQLTARLRREHRMPGHPRQHSCHAKIFRVGALFFSNPQAPYCDNHSTIRLFGVLSEQQEKPAPKIEQDHRNCEPEAVARSVRGGCASAQGSSRSRGPIR